MSQEINNREYRQKVIRELLAELHDGKSVDEVKAKFETAKEESILFPMLMETLVPGEWKRIAEESVEIGYFLIPPPPAWTPADAGCVTLPTGALRLVELTRMLDTLPIDITFVDKDDRVNYFSQGRGAGVPPHKGDHRTGRGKLSSTGKRSYCGGHSGRL